MKTICVNGKMINIKGPNESFGNHVLHLFACWTISKKLNINLSINSSSNLDDVFDFEKKDISTNINLYTEKYGGDMKEHCDKEIENNDFFEKLLSGLIDLPESFYIEGWFWNSIFLPTKEFFSDFKVKPELLREIELNHNFIRDDNTLVIHYRGSDFSNHSIGWGDLRLKEDYYEKCLEDFSENKKNFRVVIVSDEAPNFLINISNKYSNVVTIEKNNYKIDWLILLLSKNIICSNSSFCYTAGWYEKNIIYQPNQFFTRYKSTDLHYPVFCYYKKNNCKVL